MELFDAYCWNLRAAMKECGLSRAELAARMDVKPTTIKSWAVGRRSPTVRRLVDLAAVLGVDVRELFSVPSDVPEAVTCGACGQSFGRAIGYRIHVALKARDCPAHAALTGGEGRAAG